MHCSYDRFGFPPDGQKCDQTKCNEILSGKPFSVAQEIQELSANQISVIVRYFEQGS